MSDQRPEYVVSKAVKAPTRGWDSTFWADVPALEIASYPWEKPGGWHPVTRAKLQYTERSLHCIFQVQDQNVLSVQTAYCGPVCTDSCVEFFFSPQPPGAPGYFNLETNCGGVPLFCWQTARDENGKQVPETDARLLAINHTLPRIVTPEIAEPVTWEIYYAVPYSVLEKISEVARPEPGVVWKANFYKCAEHNTRPHWGSWAPVNTPRPDFHRPECFGTLRFG